MFLIVSKLTMSTAIALGLHSNVATVHPVQPQIVQHGQANTIQYKIHPGDTLWDIAYNTNTSVKNLKDLNHLSSDRIYVNDVITLKNGINKDHKSSNITNERKSIQQDKKSKSNNQINSHETKQPVQRAQTVTLVATAYSYSGGVGNGRTTASGQPVHEGIVAADTSIYPFGTKFIINDQTYTVADTGGAIKGNRIDIFFSSEQKAIQFGRRTVQAKVLR